MPHDKPRLVVLSSSFPYPVDAGRKAVLAGFLDCGVAALGAENVVLICVASVEDEEERASLSPCRVVFFRPAAFPYRAALLALNSLLLRRRSIQEMLVAGPAVTRRIAGVLERFDPDVVLVDTIRMVQHLPRASRRGRRCVLYLDDLYSLRYRRTISAMVDHPDAAFDPIGTFERFLPPALRRFILGRSVLRRLLAFESGVLARREMKMPGQFDHVLLLNKDEAARLTRATGAKNVSAAMPLLPRPRGGEAPARRFAGDPIFLFLGNLRYPANALGLSLFLQRTMPKFLARVSTGSLVVVGSGARPDLRDIGSRFGQRVSFLDYVEDLDALCGSAAGMVVPLVFGTGVKIKVIEALARGLPIISTSCGIDGLGLEPGIHCLVEDDVSHFAAAMVRLLDPVLNADLARQSLACYRDRFAPEVVARVYRAVLFDQLPARGQPISAPDREGRGSALAG